MRETKIIYNNKGVLLLMVIMLTIVLSIIAISVMSVNVSQVKTSQSIVDSIKAEQLAIGVFYLCHQALNEGAEYEDCDAFTGERVLDGKAFNVEDIEITDNNLGPNDTDPVNVTVTYR